jgi:hypothetical protein
MMSYEFMLERFEFYLERGGGRHSGRVGVVVLDQQKPQQEESLRAAHERFRREGTSAQRIDLIVEAPFFAPSHASPMLQIADLVAYWCNRLMRSMDKGELPPPQWQRLWAHIDRTRSRDVGFKRFP